MYNAIKGQSTSCQDSVLSTVKNMFCQTNKACCGRKWPSNNRLLRSIIIREAGNFWDNVTHTKKNCLRQFNLPHCESVTFTYLDPIFVWIQQCNLLHDARHKLQWKPKKLQHPQTHERIYGAGIQYGLLFEQACQDIPEQGKVALMNLSWDGGNTGFGSRSATPICIQVMNANVQSVLAAGLVGYLPQLDVADSMKSRKACKNARHHVLQVSPHSCFPPRTTDILATSTHWVRKYTLIRGWC